MIVVAKDKNTNEVYMACSLSERMCDNDPRDMMLDNNVTIWKVPSRENTYVGVSAAGFGADLLRYSSIFDVNGELDSMVIIREILPKYLDLLKEMHQLDEEGKTYFTTVIVDNGNIFTIELSNGVEMVEDCYASGYYASVIKGSLYALRDSNMPVVNKIAEAFHCLDVMKMNGSLPVTVWNLTTNKKTFITNYNDFGVK